MLYILYLILPIKAINLKTLCSYIVLRSLSEIIARLVMYIILAASTKVTIFCLYIFKAVTVADTLQYIVLFM